MLSEEEIINSIENVLKYKTIIDNAPFKIETIQGLLDLYNKEKEKNKELEEADLTTVYMNGFYDGEQKWKDKIKEKIEEFYPKGGTNVVIGTRSYGKSIRAVIQMVLKELLEGE